MPETENAENKTQQQSGANSEDRHELQPRDRGQQRSSGQGAVRSKEDGRLQDNLSPEQRSEIGRKGGHAVSRNRDHMASIGRKGGLAVSSNREHMAQIGQKGGRS